MATQRREQTVKLAEALGLQFDRAEATSELMDRCIERAESLAGMEPEEREAPARMHVVESQGEAKPTRRRRKTGQRAA